MIANIITERNEFRNLARTKYYNYFEDRMNTMLPILLFACHYSLNFRGWLVGIELIGQQNCVCIWCSGVVCAGWGYFSHNDTRVCLCHDSF